jgi:RNA polymerase sigma factor (sigma-70 family)
VYMIEMQEFDARLQKVLAAIPDGAREVFLMNRIEDMKYREIADRLGISVKAVEKRMSKALQIIREQLNVDI